MLEQDIKVLEFKQELMKLLNKYKYNISGTIYDDGSMIIEGENGDSYMFKNEYENYSISKEVFVENCEWDYKYVNLMEEYILGSFNDNKHDNFTRYNIGIITSDKNKAEKILNDIIENNKDDIDRFINSKTRMELILKNELRYIWIRPFPNARGYKLRSAYIDRDIDLDIFEDIIIPICAYCSKDDIKVI